MLFEFVSDFWWLIVLILLIGPGLKLHGKRNNPNKSE